MKQDLRAAFRVCLLFALLVSMRATGLTLYAPRHWVQSVEWLLQTFAIVTPVAFVLVASGVVLPNPDRPYTYGKMKLSPWFGWLVGGGFAAFWIAAWPAVAAWAAILVAIGLARRVPWPQIRRYRLHDSRVRLNNVRDSRYGSAV